MLPPASLRATPTRTLPTSTPMRTPGRTWFRSSMLFEFVGELVNGIGNSLRVRASALGNIGFPASTTPQGLSCHAHERSSCDSMILSLGIDRHNNQRSALCDPEQGNNCGRFT